MKQAAVFLTLAALLLLASTAGAQSAVAQSGEGYELSWYTVAGGGGRAEGGDYTLDSTAGQPAAGKMEGGDFSVGGGFWPGAAAQYRIHLPLIWKGL